VLRMLVVSRSSASRRIARLPPRSARAAIAFGTSKSTDWSATSRRARRRRRN